VSVARGLATLGICGVLACVVPPREEFGIRSKVNPASVLNG
jgi:hypothetical protein